LLYHAPNTGLNGSKKMSNFYHLRVDIVERKGLTSVQIINMIIPYLDVGIIACIEKTSTNPHMHAMFNSQHTIQAIRKHVIAFMKKYEQHGNGAYSLTKVRDYIKTAAYIIKDGELVINTLVPDEDLALAKDYDKTVKKKSLSILSKHLSNMYFLRDGRRMRKSMTFNLENSRKLFLTTTKITELL